MKIMNHVFLSFNSKEEYLQAMRIWKWNMQQLIYKIKSNKINVRQQSKLVSNPIENAEFFRIESLNSLAEYQRNSLSLAKIATQMLKIHSKMKKMAGKQMKERLNTGMKQLELVTV